MSKTIWINCKQVCEYKQQVTVTDEEYEILMNEADQGDVQETHKRNSPYSIIEAHLNYNEVFDTEHEFTEVSIELEQGDLDDAGEFQEEEDEE